MISERHLFKELVMKESGIVGLGGNHQGKIVGS